MRTSFSAGRACSKSCVQNAPPAESTRARGLRFLRGLLLVKRAFFRLRNGFDFESVAVAATFFGSKAMTGRASNNSRSNE